MVALLSSPVVPISLSVVSVKRALGLCDVERGRPSVNTVQIPCSTVQVNTQELTVDKPVMRDKGTSEEMCMEE